MESFYRDISALDENHRRSVEALLGHRLEGHEKLYIAVLSSAAPPTAEERQRAWEQVHQASAEIENSARQRGLTPDEWATIATEECDAVRYGKQS